MKIKNNVESLKIDWIAELFDWAIKYDIKDILEIQSYSIYKTQKKALLDLYGLNVSNKHLSSLPDAIINLQKLNYLIISHNQFKEFPSIIFELDALEFLDISHNHLTTIPYEIVKMKSLSHLTISWNKIKTIPKYLHFSGICNYLWNENDMLEKVDD